MFNGHKNWNHWNVSLWINNDEGLYRDAVLCRREYGDTLDEAADRMMFLLDGRGITHTPDGAPYTKTSVRAAMRDL